MSAIGSATARGPEMWCDTGRLRVRGLIEQGRERRMLERVLGRRIIEDALERVVDALGLLDLLDGAAVVARVPARRLLGAEDEGLDGGEVGQALIALDVPEDRVEQLERLGGEVHHVGVPRSVEARGEQQP